MFVHGTEIIRFKAKDSETIAHPLGLGKISKDWLVDNIKKTGFNGYIYDFSVDYNAISVSDVLNIHKYLLKKNEITVVHVYKTLVALRRVKMYKSDV